METAKYEIGTRFIDKQTGLTWKVISVNPAKECVGAICEKTGSFVSWHFTTSMHDHVNLSLEECEIL